MPRLLAFVFSLFAAVTWTASSLLNPSVSSWLAAGCFTIVTLCWAVLLRQPRKQD